MLISLLFSFVTTAATVKETGFLPRAMTCRDPRTGARVRVTPSLRTFRYGNYLHQRQTIEVYGVTYQSRLETVPTAKLVITPLYETDEKLLYHFYPGADWRGKFDFDPGTLSPQINFYTESNYNALTLDHCR